jgi:hypothetical protein
VYEWVSVNKPQNEAALFFEKVSSDIRNLSRFRKEEFQGYPDRLSFYIHEPGYLLDTPKDASKDTVSIPSIYKVQYRFDYKNKKLVRSIYNYGTKQPMRESVVLAEADKVIFQYYNMSAKNGDFSFDDEAGTEPKAVKIKVDMGGHRGLYYKTIDIPLNSG